MLVLHHQEIPRTHDLEALLSVVIAWVPALQEQFSDLQWLTTYAVGSRYLVELFGDVPGQAESQRADAIVQAVREVCREYIQSAGFDLSAEEA